MTPTYRRSDLDPPRLRLTVAVAVGIPVVVAILTAVAYCGRMR